MYCQQQGQNMISGLQGHNYAVSLGTVVLADRQKEKKVMVAAAHNMALLNEVPWSQTALSFRRIEGVIGGLGQGVLPVLPA